TERWHGRCHRSAVRLAVWPPIRSPEYQGWRGGAEDATEHDGARKRPLLRTLPLLTSCYLGAPCNANTCTRPYIPSARRYVSYFSLSRHQSLGRCRGSQP
ncbi:MAG: hypothetical protein MHM6MM_008037, partial [Cercozoa sp. M6MM]